MSKYLTSVGTLRKNKACIPPEFQPYKKRETRLTIYVFQKNVTPLPKPGKVIFLHHVGDMAEKNKYFDLTKGGVDIFDQLIHK